VQARVAAHLARRAARMTRAPHYILDLGCGTGFAAMEAARRWPQANITALDAAPEMLATARGKLPELETIAGDAATLDFAPRFDLILSSMALHWITDPRAMLMKGRGWLAPQGKLHVALPVAGSFRQWRDLCAREGIEDGLWNLPAEDFADGLAVSGERQSIEVEYPSAHDFLRRLKAIGAATPRVEHRPAPVPALRRLLMRAPRPFAVNYDLQYLELAAAPLP